MKSDHQHEGDDCILHPRDCSKGISFSIWEKIKFGEEVLNVRKVHSKQYIFSTGQLFICCLLNLQLSYAAIRW